MLKAEQGDDNTTGHLLDYDCIKNHYRLIAVDLSRHKIDADWKAIQEIEFITKLQTLDKIGHATDADDNQSIFLLQILENIYYQNYIKKV